MTDYTYFPDGEISSAYSFMGVSPVKEDSEMQKVFPMLLKEPAGRLSIVMKQNLNTQKTRNY